MCLIKAGVAACVRAPQHPEILMRIMPSKPMLLTLDLELGGPKAGEVDEHEGTGGASVREGFGVQVGPIFR
jgi:hypothetical protein